ncbi:MAG: sulfur carrier protein ThiS [Elusimicrobiota bacterium]|jgi:thiamine biosynthesis protein ThiS|nr:sulfur carrier protein ThiS [Elusimicrobiota bacterium]
MIKIKVNGKEKEIADNVPIFNFLSENKIVLDGVFVGYNGAVIAKNKLGGIILKNGDILEIIRIAAGG